MGSGKLIDFVHCLLLVIGMCKSLAKKIAQLFIEIAAQLKR